MAEHDNLDLTYEEALQELQDILGRMQSNELGIDSLTENIQRARSCSTSVKASSKNRGRGSSGAQTTRPRRRGMTVCLGSVLFELVQQL